MEVGRGGISKGRYNNYSLEQERKKIANNVV